MWRVAFDPRAAKELDAVDGVLRGRILRALARLADDPHKSPNVKALSGQDAYRLRAGDYRILYVLRDTELLVLVVKIGHRREIYR